MNSRIVTFTTLLASLNLALPVSAQILRPSQEFFEEGREQLEQEIQILQIDPFDLDAESSQDPDLDESLQQGESEPLLEVQPALPSAPTQPSEFPVPSPPLKVVD